MRILIVSLLLILSTLASGQLLRYPETPKEPFNDTVQQIVFTDDFKWLEDGNNLKVKTWLKKQNDFTNDYFQKSTRLSRTWYQIEEIAHVSFNLPQREGKYYFHWAYEEQNSPPTLFYAEDPGEQPYPLIRPRDISTKETINLSTYAVSDDDQYLAYSYHRNGLDWQEIRIMDMKTKQTLQEKLVDVKFSSIAWAGEGFFYSRYSRNTGKFATALGEEIWYHTIHSLQQQDQLIYSSDGLDANEINVSVINGGKDVLIYDENNTKQTRKIFIREVGKENATNKLLLSGKATEISILGGHRDSLVALSHYNNDRGSIIKFSLNNPRQWVEFIEEDGEGTIVEATAFKDGIITVLASAGAEYVVIYDWEGDIKKVIGYPVGFKVSGFRYNNNDRKVYFYLSSTVIPPIVYEMDLKTYKYKKTDEKTVITYDYRDFKYDKVEYTSNDGTKIPMLLVYKKTLKKDGSNPTILKTYGGFGMIIRPSFDPAMIHFLNQGGVYAYAYVRGEGILGKKWGLAGRGQFKQQSFSDFIAGAEFLINEKITKPSKLAITGGSNGGLVVAAAFTQRPDLFKAAVPEMGLYDLIHFENETVGVVHTDEYGTVKDPRSFQRLLAYSPLHHVDPQKTYPAMLIVTAENDERVAPYHSYKLAAKLQQINQQRPILLRAYANEGHSGTSTWDSQNKSRAEKIAFILSQLKDDQ